MPVANAKRNGSDSAIDDLQSRFISARAIQLESEMAETQEPAEARTGEDHEPTEDEPGGAGEAQNKYKAQPSRTDEAVVRTTHRQTGATYDMGPNTQKRRRAKK